MSFSAITSSLESCEERDRERERDGSETFGTVNTNSAPFFPADQKPTISSSSNIAEWEVR